MQNISYFRRKYILKKINSNLQKALNKYEYLFNDWKKTYFNDGSIEECCYNRERLKIVFQEDLREHIVNLSILHPSKRYIKVYFRTCSNFSDELDVEELTCCLKELGNSNNIETQEVDIYIDFLIKNRIL